LIRRIEHRLKHIEPTLNRLIATDRRDQEVTGAGRRHVSHPDGFRPIASQLFIGGFQQVNRRRTAKRL